MSSLWAVQLGPEPRCGRAPSGAEFPGPSLSESSDNRVIGVTGWGGSLWLISPSA